MKLKIGILASVLFALCTNESFAQDAQAVLQQQQQRVNQENTDRQLREIIENQRANSSKQSEPVFIPVETGVSTEKYNTLVERYNSLLENYKIARAALAKGANQTTQDKFEAAVEESHQKATLDFPVMLDKGHAIHALATLIFNQLEAEKNPLAEDSNAPWICYYLAAQKLGIKPAVSKIGEISR